MIDGTPIIDIKPYLTLSDCKPDAICGFSDETKENNLKVFISDEISDSIPENILKVISSMLSQDPRPSYHNDPSRIYSMSYSEYDVKFSVSENTLTVISILKS